MRRFLAVASAECREVGRSGFTE